jgi:hypothetical protein
VYKREASPFLFLFGSQALACETDEVTLIVLIERSLMAT